MGAVVGLTGGARHGRWWAQSAAGSEMCARRDELMGGKKAAHCLFCGQIGVWALGRRRWAAEALALETGRSAGGCST